MRGCTAATKGYCVKPRRQRKTGAAAPTMGLRNFPRSRLRSEFLKSNLCVFSSVSAARVWQQCVPLGQTDALDGMEKVSAAAKANLASGDVGAVTDMLGKLGATYVSQPS